MKQVWHLAELAKKPAQRTLQSESGSVFNNEAFDNRPDLAANDTATVMLDEYLRGFDNNGWLISSVDKGGYNEIINEPELPD